MTKKLVKGGPKTKTGKIVITASLESGIKYCCSLAMKQCEGDLNYVHLDFRMLYSHPMGILQSSLFFRKQINTVKAN